MQTTFCENMQDTSCKFAMIGENIFLLFYKPNLNSNQYSNRLYTHCGNVYNYLYSTAFVNVGCSNSIGVRIKVRTTFLSALGSKSDDIQFLGVLIHNNVNISPILPFTNITEHFIA